MSTIVNCLRSTPVESHHGILVKREDLCTIGSAGPPFSKMRGVIEHVASRPEDTMGVLDTYHSQAGHAVAFACSLLGKRCVNFWPRRKADRADALRSPQIRSRALGADLVALDAGMSAVLYHRAKGFLTELPGTYMMPNALKLPEMVTATAREVHADELVQVDRIVVSISSGTIAAGVLVGLEEVGWQGEVILHMGYSRPVRSVIDYLERITGRIIAHRVSFVDEGYSYGDAVASTAPFPCNVYYDAKAWKWLMGHWTPRTMFWNVGA